MKPSNPTKPTKPTKPPQNRKSERGVRVDRRNRLRACEIAGIEPTFQELNGVDPMAYILLVTINRRPLAGIKQTILNGNLPIWAVVHPFLLVLLDRCLDYVVSFG